MIHPTRNTFDEELVCWVSERGYPREVASRCLKMMRGWGYKLQTKGMFQGCFEIVRNTEINRDINRMTYHLMKYTGGDEEIDRLDQHITSFVIFTQFKDLKILPVDEFLVTDGRLMQWYAHNSFNPIGHEKLIPAMMRGKACETWKPAGDATGTAAKPDGEASGMAAGTAASKPKTTKRANRKEK